MKQPLTRSASDKFLGGVAGGVARAFGIDATLVRIGFVVIAFFTQIGWVAYLAAWLLLPLEEGGPTGLDELKKLFSGGTQAKHDDFPNSDDLR